jgi:hypothetical protein
MFGKSERLIEDFEEMLDLKFQQKLDENMTKTFNRYLEKFREIVDSEKKIIEDAALESIQKIESVGKQLTKMNELTKMNLELVQEIRIRDAKIKRKEKQIERLKKEKNAV